MSKTVEYSVVTTKTMKVDLPTVNDFIVHEGKIVFLKEKRKKCYSFLLLDTDGIEVDYHEAFDFNRFDRDSVAEAAVKTAMAICDSDEYTDSILHIHIFEDLMETMSDMLDD